MPECTWARSASVDGAGKCVDSVSRGNGEVIMLGGDCRKFLNDELGGTVMGLLWFILFVAITGLAVDSINGFHNRALIRATAAADAAALAGVIDLPNDATVVASAVALSAGNMPTALNGSVLKAGVPKE